jgi:hypothetical protein
MDPVRRCSLRFIHAIKERDRERSRVESRVITEAFFQANYINALAVSVLPFFEPAIPMTLGGLFVTLGGFWYDIG